MRIAPESKTGNLAEILIADVESAGEGDPTIHDQDFSMIAHVDLDAPPQRIEGQELPALAPRLSKRLEGPTVQPVRTHGVIEQAHLDALLGFFAKELQQDTTGFI